MMVIKVKMHHFFWCIFMVKSNITNQPPSTLTIIFGETANSSLIAVGLVVSYQFYLNTNSVLTWTKINNTGNFIGVKT